jgi:hypothetical protein
MLLDSALHGSSEFERFQELLNVCEAEALDETEGGAATPKSGPTPP